MFKTRNHDYIADHVTELLFRIFVSSASLPPSAIPYRDTKGGIRILLSRVSLERHEDSK